MALFEAYDLYGLLQDYGPFIIVAFGLIMLVAYLYVYLARFFNYLKLKEHKYVSERTINSIHRYLKVIGIGMLIIGIVLAGRFLQTEGIAPVFEFVRNYVFVFLALVVFFVFAMMARLSSSVVEHHRIKTQKDQNAVIKPGILEFYELFLKYGLHVIGVIVAILVGILTIPDQTTREQIFHFLMLDTISTSEIWGHLLSLVIILIVLFVIGEFIHVILDDLKQRSKKFQPELVEVIKAAARYILYWIAFFITLIVILEILNFQHLEIVMWFFVAVTIAVVIVVGLSPAMRSAISGIVLLITDSVNKGDWVQIDKKDTGEVLSQGLTITRLKTRTGDIIDLPNEKVFGSSVHNFTKLGGTRIRVTLRLDAGAPIETTEKMLVDCAIGLEKYGTDSSKIPRTWITAIDEKTIEYNIDIWTKYPASTEELVSEFLKRIHKKAKDANIHLFDAKISY
jgi:small-conductance mechanosensitive channel